MTYNAVLELQARVPAQLDRCWTQHPVILVDALGRVTPFHLEFIDSWEVRPGLDIPFVYLAYKSREHVMVHARHGCALADNLSSQ